MEINLGTASVIETQPVQTITLTTLTVEKFSDYPGEKKLYAFIPELKRDVLVFEGAEYDATGNGTGQWTDEEAEDKIISMFGA
jgi:hypothetical protein